MSGLDQCPHCDEGVTVPCDRLDDHIFEAHAELPPCTARISNAATENQTVRCVFRVGHRDEFGTHHAGRYDERNGGRYRWGDNAMGAVPHQETSEPHTGLVVQPYRENGQQKWVFRCWGTDTCDGWLSLDHSSEQSAERARDRHVTEAHPELKLDDTNHDEPSLYDAITGMFARPLPWPARTRCSCGLDTPLISIDKAGQHWHQAGEEGALATTGVDAEPSEVDQLRADVESLRYQIRRAREALAEDEPAAEPATLKELGDAIRYARTQRDHWQRRLDHLDRLLDMFTSREAP